MEAERLAANSQSPRMTPAELIRVLDMARPRKCEIMGVKLVAWYTDRGSGFRGLASGVLPEAVTERMQGTAPTPTGNHGTWFHTGKEAMDELRRVVKELHQEDEACKSHG